MLVWISVLLTGPCAAFAGHFPKQSRPTLEIYLKKLGYVAIPLRRGQHNELYVESQLGGKTRRLVLDTGCTITVLDTSVAKKFRTLRELGGTLEDPSLPTNVIVHGPIVVVDDLNLGPTHFPNQPAVVMAYSHSTVFGDGILGCDFFIRHFCLLDCTDLRLYARREQLNTRARDALERSLSQSGYHAARLDDSDFFEFVCDAKMNGKPVKLLVDTGGEWTILNEKAAARCGLSWRGTYVDLKGIGKVRDTRLSYTKLDSFEIDGAQVPAGELYIGVADMAGWKFGAKNTPRETVDGILGAELLANNGALIDFRQRKLWFEPTKPAVAKVKTPSKSN